MVSLIDQSLKDRDPDNEERITPLHLAAEDGYDGVVTYLIKQGRDLNARDLNDDTPLHLAARAGKLSIVILLLKAGAQMNVKNKDLKYPLLVIPNNKRNGIYLILFLTKTRLPLLEIMLIL